MAKPWSEVAASPQFQALPPDQKEAARSQYFDTVVAPQVPPEHLGDARSQFDSATKMQAPPKAADPDGLSDVQRSLMAGDSEGLSEGAPGLKDIASALPQGVNSSVLDLAGLPMDTATNAANLVKVPLGLAASTMTKLHDVPSMLQADDPADVPGTSAYLKNKVREAGGGNLIDPADNAAARGVHMASEAVGITPLAAGAGKVAAAVNDISKATEAAGGSTGRPGVRPGEGTPLESLRSAGYKVRPTDVTAANPAEPASALSKIGEAVAGSKEMQRDYRLHNQTKTTEFGGQVLGKPDAKKLLPQDFAKAKEAPGKVYDSTGSKLGQFDPSPDLEMHLESLGDTQGLDPSATTEVSRLLKRVRSGERFNGQEIVRDISRLREIKGGRIVADALEDEVGRQLQDNPEALDEFRAARTQFAQIYTVQENTRRGQLNATKIGEIHAKNPNLLTGPLRVVGIAANEAPGVMGLPSTAASGPLEKITAAVHTLGIPVRKYMASETSQSQYGGVADPTTASYTADAGKGAGPRTTRPVAPVEVPPPLQIEHQPGEVPVPTGAEVDAGGPRAPVNNPAELNSVLEQAAGAVQANPPATPTPQVSPTIQGQRLLPAPGNLAPRGAQVPPIKVTPEGNARLSDPVRDFIADQGTQGNPAEARRATMSTILAKGIREEPALPANWLRVERAKPGHSHLSIEDARRQYIIEALRNQP